MIDPAGVLWHFIQNRAVGGLTAKARPSGGRPSAGSRRRTSGRGRAAGRRPSGLRVKTSFDEPTRAHHSLANGSAACFLARAPSAPRDSRSACAAEPARPDQQVARVLHRTEHFGDRFHDQPLRLAVDPVDHDVAPPVDRSTAPRTARMPPRTRRPVRPWPARGARPRRPGAASPRVCRCATPAGQP